MVVIRTKVRAASVPVGGPLDVDEFSSFNNIPTYNTRLISNAALDDADVMTSASRRHDRQFINHVNNSLINAPFIQPVVTKRARIPYHKEESFNRGRQQSPMRLAGIKIDSDYDDENDRVVRMMTPVTNEIIRSKRSCSVPPLSNVTRSLDPIASSRYSYDTGPLYKTAPLNGEVLSNNRIYDWQTNYNKLNPVADLAIRQANRNLDRIELELRKVQDDVPPSSAYYVYTDINPRRRSSSYHGPRSSLAYRDARDQPVIIRRSAARDPSPVSYLRRSAARDPSPVSYYNRRNIQPFHLTNDIVLDSAGNQHNYHSLNTPSISSTNKIYWSVPHKHSNLLANHDVDQNLPVVLRNFELNTSNVHPATSYKPPGGAIKRTIPDKFGLPVVAKPTVSNTRKKVREVLCKIKGDPNYFDD